jgi:hypothetical protein
MKRRLRDRKGLACMAVHPPVLSIYFKRVSWADCEKVHIRFKKKKLGGSINGKREKVCLACK